MHKFDDIKSQQKVAHLKHQEEEQSTQLLAKRYELHYISLKEFPVETDAIFTVERSMATANELAVFAKKGKFLKVGIRNPKNEGTQAVLRDLRRNHFILELYMVSLTSLEYAWDFYQHTTIKQTFHAGGVSVSQDRIVSLQRRFHNIRDVRSEIERTFEQRVTEIFEVILAGALALDTSDVHVEPQEFSARLRFRIDGLLEDIVEIPRKLFPSLTSRLKLVSELKLNIHDKPQDGRFTISISDQQIEVRVSLMPGPAGENIVMRILNPGVINLEIKQLGMQPWIQKTIEHELKRTKGMVLTTGPTGSGKTTALYSFLLHKYTPEIKIITIEDPIEYHLQGIEQTQISKEKGYTFSNSLRAVVRQDPDVILVGEIRDLETAEAAMHAALTGHLVFSTLHTNNAAATVPRLIDLGVEPAIIAPAINVMMAQRLLRKLCMDCKQEYTFNEEEKARLKKEFDEMPKETPIPPEKEWTLYAASGKECLKCHETGYKGRTGIYEIIQIDPEIERLILKQPSEYDIQNQSRKQGQINMREDGLLKVLSGQTDLTELDRVTNV